MTNDTQELADTPATKADIIKMEDRIVVTLSTWMIAALAIIFVLGVGLIWAATSALMPCPH